MINQSHGTFKRINWKLLFRAATTRSRIDDKHLFINFKPENSWYEMFDGLLTANYIEGRSVKDYSIERWNTSRSSFYKYSSIQLD